MTEPLPPIDRRCFALVPCAGAGERAGPGLAKQYRPLAGRSVVAHTVAALAAVRRIVRTLVVLAPGDADFARCVPHFGGWVAHVGGASRAQSVANGLAALRDHGASADDWVLVHDAARCLVRPADVDRLIDACETDARQGDAIGGLLALPVADTLKRATGPAGQDRVAATLDRRGLWQAQTPQMFPIGLLQQALARAGDAVTDDASAIEALGHAPRLVPGAVDNLKLTWPGDFAVAEQLLRARA